MSKIPIDPTTIHVRRAVDGDCGSLNWVVERFSPLLRMQAEYRLSSGFLPMEPEDLVAEVWSVALPKLRHLEEREKRLTPVLVSFLGGILLRRYRTLLQRAVRGESTGGFLVEEIPKDITEAGEAASRSEEVGKVARALELLAPEDREILVHRVIEGTSLLATAELLELSPNLCAQRSRRALDRLRSALPGSIFEQLQVSG